MGTEIFPEKQKFSEGGSIKLEESSAVYVLKDKKCKGTR